jgi:membrane-associated phospholipid phosphatase
MVAISTSAQGHRRDATVPLLIAGLCAIGLVLTWMLADLVPATHVRDAVALYDFTRLDHPLVEAPANALLDLLDPPFFVVWALVIVVVALSRGRARMALAVAIVLTIAPLSAELLKPLVAHPHVQIRGVYITDASWPSGHATAALSLAWCAVLVAPSVLRPTLVLLGTAFALAVGVALLILAWHMPSDVLGGYLLATLWTSLAVAVLRWSRSRSQRRVRLGSIVAQGGPAPR